jgi:hypothetical protein
MKVALVCIAKNEDYYIEEWVNYYKKLGFDDIYIYQNDWRWSGESENVHKIEFDGLNKQRVAYHDFIINHKNKYDWAAFFDVDEFLVLKKHNNIKEFLSDYNDYPAVGINWVFFGDNGHKKIETETSVLKRFTKRETKVNYHVKCIIKLFENIRMDIHNPNTVWVDTEKFAHRGPFNPKGNDNIAQLNHYFCKTISEFEEKCARGRADTIIHKRTTNEFHKSNFNEIEDLTAFNFYFNT